MRVGVTGASGHLGTEVVEYLYDRGHIAVPIGHTLPTHGDFDAVLHLAAPQPRDVDDIDRFRLYNRKLATWADDHNVRIINAGSWWEYAGREAQRIPYTRMKHDQRQLLGRTTLTLFSVYGGRVRDGRGFVPQLVKHITGEQRLQAASREPRDWVHVRDICRALELSLQAPAGHYDIATGQAISPAALLHDFTGEEIDDWPDVPSATVHYYGTNLPGWWPRIGIHDYIQQEAPAWPSPTATPA